jgi:acetolactate synthase-1/2/3 large subunit
MASATGTPGAREATRIGADLAIETLHGLGVRVVFGVPGVHALAYWDAMRRTEMRYVGARTELAAAFAADGFTRASGAPAALALSTGPGTLISLAGLMEAATSYVPVVAIASQIETGLLGRSRGALHELDDQLAPVASVVKAASRVASVDAIPSVLAEAWARALEPPTGPVFVEIPVDLLNATADREVVALPATRGASSTVIGDLDGAAARLRAATAPVVLAGGGVVAGGAWREVRELAERMDAPVLTTFMGKGALPDDHPLLAGCAADEPPYQDALRSADLVLCVGSELGEEPTSGYAVRFDGELIQIDASGRRIGSTYEATPLIGDASRVLGGLLTRMGDHRDRGGLARAAQIREAIEESLSRQERQRERGLVRAIRAALPASAITAWDMTILGYWAARDFPAGGPRRFLYPVGSGTLGYAWPAAIGASLAEPDEAIVAIAGDGGAMYALQELASARQAGSSATLVIVDDGGYGILREYQLRSYGGTHGVELVRPDFVALAQSFGVRAIESTTDDLQADLEQAISADGPSVIALRESLRPPTTMA